MESTALTWRTGKRHLPERQEASALSMLSDTNVPAALSLANSITAKTLRTPRGLPLCALRVFSVRMESTALHWRTGKRTLPECQEASALSILADTNVPAALSL